MAKSTRSVLKSYEKQYKKSQNDWRKKNGFPTKKKNVFYDKYYTTSKRSKVIKSKPINTKYYMESKQLNSNTDAQKNNGCYIATCVYGSYDCPEVWTLRRFRDYTLGMTWYGRVFIKCYYAISPSIVKRFGRRIWFRKFCKKYLDVWVLKLNERGVSDTKYTDKY